MKRFALAVVAAAVVAGVASADLPPPPGEKYVAVTTSVKLEKELPDYSFYTIGFGPGASGLTKVDLDPKKATKVDAKSRYGGQFYAVPNSVVKELKTDANLSAALRKEKKPDGVVAVGISNRSVLKDTDKRNSIDVVLVVAADEKAGVKITEEKVEKKDEKEKEPEEPTASAPFGGKLLIVGLAAALALVAGGLWVIRRK